ncbi:MAG TPA: ankyrin repeat domain-containing protein [Pyrinomonadaceae bacterium]|nr:ankyrin repeat domain-containing protein [Pyrinomonadaceae bacterium]
MLLLKSISNYRRFLSMNRSLSLLILLLSCSPLAGAQQRPIDKEFLDAVQKRDLAKINTLLNQGANVNAHDDNNGYFALQYAINWPDASLVKLLLDKGADVNAADEMGNTALTEAAHEHGPEYTAIIKLLIERRADIHAHHDAAILGAARYAEPEVVKLLLAKGAQASARDSEQPGDTVLMAAASGASLETLQLLLAAGADVNAINDEGQTALMKAVTMDHRYNPAQRVPMIELLLSKGAELNAKAKDGKTPLLYSVVQYMSEAGGVISHPEVVKLLLDRGADIKASDRAGDNALLISARVWQGPVDIVRLLLAKGIDVNWQNNKGISALMIAAEKTKPDILNLLLEKGVDLNLRDAEGATALDHAVSAGNTDIAKTILARGGHSKKEYKSQGDLITATTNFALLRAATTSNFAEVKNLVAAGADINSRDHVGATPVMLTVEYGYGRVDVLTFLVDKGADLNALNINGETALMLAVSSNNSEAATVLLAHKAAIEPRNTQLQTAFHLAVAGLRQKIVAAILATYPTLDVDARDASGRTPLMLAANNEGFVPDDVMQLLIDRGAKVNAQDNQGYTALMIAAKVGQMAGVEFLLGKGASVDLKNNAGETALKLARLVHENKQISNADLVEGRIVEMLLKAGAKN